LEFFIYFQGSPCTPDRPVSQFGFLKPPAHLVFENGKGAMVDIPSTAPKELPAVSRVKLPWTKPVLDSRMAFWHSRGLLFRIFLPSSGPLLGDIPRLISQILRSKANNCPPKSARGCWMTLTTSSDTSSSQSTITGQTPTRWSRAGLLAPSDQYRW
jgi:hypothetical protein